MPRSSMIDSLCRRCVHRKEVVSAKGSRFLLCQKSQVDRRYPKYPPQPVANCQGFELDQYEHQRLGP